MIKNILGKHRKHFNLQNGWKNLFNLLPSCWGEHRYRLSCPLDNGSAPAELGKMFSASSFIEDVQHLHSNALGSAPVHVQSFHINTWYSAPAL
jgi:hypothetical protein